MNATGGDSEPDEPTEEVGWEETEETEELDDDGDDLIAIDDIEDASFVNTNRKYMNAQRIPVLEIPAGTFLFRGVPAIISDEHPGWVGDIGWFADLKVAGTYAFRQDKVIGKPVTQSDGGKIITFRVNRSVRLFDLQNCHSERHLRQIIGNRDPELLSLLTRIYKCEGDIPKRNSIIGMDDKIAEWICAHTDLDGWAYDENIGFHPEVMLCSPDDKIKRIPFEYRYDRRDPEKITVTYSGAPIARVDRSHVGGVKGLSKSYYKPDQSKLSDAFLFLSKR
jgi:hypothetical protein